MDFIQILAIRNLRSRGISLQTIREGVEEYQNKYNIQYPFARKHVSYLLQRGQGDKFGGLYILEFGDDRKNIFTKVISARKGQFVSKGQMALTKIVEFYMSDLHFNQEGIAESYEALSRNYRDKIKKIVLRPERRFGEPIVESCGITPQTLYDASMAEGSIDDAAYMYGVEAEDVDISCRYIDHLTPKTGDKAAA